MMWASSPLKRRPPGAVVRLVDWLCLSRAERYLLHAIEHVVDTCDDPPSESQVQAVELLVELCCALDREAVTR